MKRYLISTALVLTLLVGVSTTAYANATTLALSLKSDGTVQLRVASNPSTNITLYYMSGSGTREQPLGATDSSGELQTVVTTSDYGIVTGSSAYVVSGDAVNGTRSTSVPWPSPAAKPITIPFSSLNISIGQAIVVPISNVGSGSIYLQNVSSPNIAANANGSIVTVTGQASGQGTINICLTGTTSNCQSLLVLVQNGNASSFAFSTPNPVVMVGKSTVIAITGSVNGSFFASANSNASVAQVNITNNAITVVGNAVGSSVVKVCNQSGECAPLTVSVIASNGNSNIATSTPAMSQSSVTVAVGQSTTILVAGNGNYTVISNNGGIATTTLTNSTNLVIQGVSPGTATVSACTSDNECGYTSVVVTPAPVYTPAPSPSPTTTATKYIFTLFLDVGSSGTSVTNLQKLLTMLGIYKGPVTGYYGVLTEAAVKKFQAAHGIKQAGYVGPSTRAALNGS